MDDSTLKLLKVTSKKNEVFVLVPPFSRKIKEYSLSVGSDVDGLQISATPNEGDAFAQVQKAGANGTVAVPEGTSDIIIKCDAADGSFSNTVIHVFRPSANDATLKELKVSAGALTPDFHRLETKYVLKVSPHITTVTINAVPINSTSKVATEGCKENGEVALDLGETDITFTVTSADGTTKQQYDIAIQKTISGTRLPVSKDSKLERDDLCSMCLSILVLPRQKPEGSKCSHNLCLPCLELFGKRESSNYVCPLCSQPLSSKSNTMVEKRLASIKYSCPFSIFGCSSTSIEAYQIPTHVLQCQSAPSPLQCKNCQGSKTYNIGKAFEGEVHKDTTCTYQCEVCQKKVSAANKQVHDSYLCLTKRESLNKSDLLESSGWETALIDKKGCPASIEACVKQATEIHHKEYLVSLAETWATSIRTSGMNPKQPNTFHLDQMSKLYATAIALNSETKKLKGGSLDENLHIQLGLVQEELWCCKNTFPPVEVKEKSKVNDNAAASASFMSDEVDGLLMSLGIAKNASDASKIKAMEEEFHRLNAAGLSDQAAEVQGLHQWKVQQVNAANGTSDVLGSGGNQQARGVGGISNALEKYEHAVGINPNSSEANYHLGRVHLQLGNFEKAQLHLEHAISNRPIFSNAQFLLAVAIMSQKTPNLSLLPHTLAFLEDAILEFHTSSWLSFKSIAGNQAIQTPQSMLCESVLAPSNTHLPAAHIALSKSYLLNATTAKAVFPIHQLTSLLTQTLSTIPSKSAAFQTASLFICEARRHFLFLLPLIPQVSPEQLLDSINQETVLSTTIAITSSKTHSQPSSSVLTKLEQISQSIVHRLPQNPSALSQLGKAQLDQIDGNPAFSKSSQKLQESIESFEAAAMLESGVGPDDVAASTTLKKVQAQDWFTELKKEMEFWAVNSKPKEVKPAGPIKGAAAGKKGAAPVKAAPAAKSVAKPAVPAAKPAPAKPAAGAKGVAPSKTQGKDAVEKSSSRPTSSKPGAPSAAAKKGSTGKLADKNASPKSSKTALAPAPTTSNGSVISSNSTFDTHIGLARAIAKKYSFMEEANAKDAGLPSLLDTLTTHYKNAIKIKSNGHDAYIELGSLLERKISIRTAADLYETFPFPELKNDNPNQDDLYLFSELGRCYMKEKRYKEPLLKECLIAEGRVNGMPALAKYVEALDGAGESKLLMAVYAGVNKKPVDHPDLVPFFKSRYWM